MTTSWRYTITVDDNENWSFDECGIVDADHITQLTRSEGHSIDLPTDDKDEARKQILNDVVAPAFFELFKMCIDKFSTTKRSDLSDPIVKHPSNFFAALVGDQSAFEAALCEHLDYDADEDDFPDLEDPNDPFFTILYDTGFALTDIHTLLDSDEFMNVERVVRHR